VESEDPAAVAVDPAALVVPDPAERPVARVVPDPEELRVVLAGPAQVDLAQRPADLAQRPADLVAPVAADLVVQVADPADGSG
jgi:hypothetical protein